MAYKDKNKAKGLFDMDIAKLFPKKALEQIQTRLDNEPTLFAVLDILGLDVRIHSLYVRWYTKLLTQCVAERMPEYRLGQNDIFLISEAAMFHDIGKIVIPPNILEKKGALSPSEWKIMTKHTTKGYDIIQKYGSTDDELQQYMLDICRYHHERWDGSGYPDGLSGENIPIGAQIVGLADAYDALTRERIYRQAVPHDEAVEMIINGKCGAFSPKLLSCFSHEAPSFLYALNNSK